MARLMVRQKSSDFLSLARIIGIECLLHAATIRLTGGAVVLVMPRLFSENWIRPQCVVVVVKRLNVLITCREYGNR